MLSFRRSASLPIRYRVIGILTVLLVSQLAHAQSGKVGLIDCPPANCLTVSVKNLLSGTPAPQQAPLPTPQFSPASGNLPYGTDVTLSVTKVAPGYFIEYSTDNGQNWTTGTSAPILKQGVVLARTRQTDRTSTIASATFDVYFKRMFVLGNSITQNSPVPALGWFNNNGMAASSLQTDYVHILERNLLALNAQFQMKLISGGGFERSFWTFDYSAALDQHLNGYAPDLIIVRIGENIIDAEAADPNRDFKARYRELLDKLTQFSGRSKVVCTTSFWNQPVASQMIREVATERGYPVADLHAVLYNRSDRDLFRAVNDYTDVAVGMHPNDRGMAEIARLIWEKIR